MSHEPPDPFADDHERLLVARDAKLDEAQARIAMLREALEGWRVNFGTIDDTLRWMRRRSDVLTTTAEQVAAWRASVESAARAKALEDAADSLDAHRWTKQADAARALIDPPRAEPTPNDDAFYRGAQTGVERALPVDDAAELKRRVRKAVDMLERTGEPDYVLEVDDVIAALRRPLPKRR